MCRRCKCLGTKPKQGENSEDFSTKLSETSPPLASIAKTKHGGTACSFNAPSAHETPGEHTSGWGTWSGQPEEPSSHADDGGEPSGHDDDGREPTGHADDGGEPTGFEEGEEGATSTSVELHGSRPCRRLRAEVVDFP